jgi:hypothetical protein
MFKKMHGMECLKNARNGKFKRCTEWNVSKMHEMGSLKNARNGIFLPPKNEQNRIFKKGMEWEV